MIVTVDSVAAGPGCGKTIDAHLITNELRQKKKSEGECECILHDRYGNHLGRLEFNPQCVIEFAPHTLHFLVDSLMYPRYPPGRSCHYASKRCAIVLERVAMVEESTWLRNVIETAVNYAHQ